MATNRYFEIIMLCITSIWKFIAFSNSLYFCILSFPHSLVPVYIELVTSVKSVVAICLISSVTVIVISVKSVIAVSADSLLPV